MNFTRVLYVLHFSWIPPTIIENLLAMGWQAFAETAETVSLRDIDVNLDVLPRIRHRRRSAFNSRQRRMAIGLLADFVLFVELSFRLVEIIAQFVLWSSSYGNIT